MTKAKLTIDWEAVAKSENGQVFEYLNETRETHDFYIIAALEQLAVQCLNLGVVKLETVKVEARVASEALKDRGVELDHLATISRKALKTPLLCETDPPYLQILDGHHRYYKAWTLGIEYLPAIIMPRVVTEASMLPDHLKPDFMQALHGAGKL